MSTHWQCLVCGLRHRPNSKAHAPRPLRARSEPKASALSHLKQIRAAPPLSLSALQFWLNVGCLVSSAACGLLVIYMASRTSGFVLLCAGLSLSPTPRPTPGSRST